MKYNTARQLKDAGFPPPKGGSLITMIMPDGTLWHPHLFEGGIPAEPWVPALEELIEACGKQFFLLEREEEDEDIRVFWLAHGGSEVDPDIKSGKTPSEAVARLWLALNKK